MSTGHQTGALHLEINYKITAVGGSLTQTGESHTVGKERPLEHIQTLQR